MYIYCINFFVKQNSSYQKISKMQKKSDLFPIYQSLFGELGAKNRRRNICPTAFSSRRVEKRVPHWIPFSSNAKLG